MGEIIERHTITEDIYREILDREIHHNHEIIKDDSGVLRWKENPDVRRYLDKIGLNDLVPLLYSLGYNKNSEVYRKLYRDMGYSLYGYWEVFYWEMNNDDADEYDPINDLALNIDAESILAQFGPEYTYTLATEFKEISDRLFLVVSDDVNAGIKQSLEFRVGGYVSDEKTIVDIMEYEKGWGSSLDEVKEFDSLELAEEFCREYNSKNKAEVTPDWYMIAIIRK